jgi:hypothetical protein
MTAKQHLKTVDGHAGLRSEQGPTRGEHPAHATAPAPAAQVRHHLHRRIRPNGRSDVCEHPVPPTISQTRGAN